MEKEFIEEPIYLGNGKHKWRYVCKSMGTSRLRVPGGWLYRYVTDNRPSITFVPYNTEN